MKKLLSLFILCLCILPISAQTTVSWNELVTMFLSSFEGETKTIEDQFASMGIDSKVTSGYDEQKKQILLEISFPEYIWNFFDSNAIKAAKDTMIAEYKNTYRTQPDFVAFIKEMDANGASFHVSYITEKDGKKLTKDFTITPKEIMD